MLLALLLATAPAPTGTLTLDIADPVVTATVAGRTLRLRVALDGQRVVEINPDVAARFADLSFENDDGAMVGRVPLAGRVAPATLAVQGRSVPVTLSTHGRACCDGVDGEIPPDLLPFAEIRFVRTGAAPAPAVRTLRMTRDPGLGLFARTPTAGGPVLLMFTLRHRATIATAAAAAALARAGEGRFVGAAATEARAFGIARPVRIMALARPVPLAGFAVSETLVRTADFRGASTLPDVPGRAPKTADILVTGRRAGQRAIPFVTLGRALLDRCAELRFTTATRRLMLACAFD